MASSDVQRKLTAMGRVVNSPGDSILAEFPRVMDAVNCAVKIQRKLAEKNAELPDERRMDFRIGINLGDVVVQDDVIYGDGVSVAARPRSRHGLSPPTPVSRTHFSTRSHMRSTCSTVPRLYMFTVGPFFITQVSPGKRVMVLPPTSIVTVPWSEVQKPLVSILWFIHFVPGAMRNSTNFTVATPGK